MYEAFFGLSGKPFQLNPDPEFFFASKGHKRALAYLDYGLHQGDGFIVITGDVGAGKTTLLRGMINRLPQDSIVATQIVSTQVEADDLLRLVAEGFGLSTENLDKSTLLTELRHFCLREYERGKRALLIVDEAQNLPPRAVEELRMLSNFQVGTRSLVQSFLVGQPELRNMMQAPEMSQLKQRIIASYHLGPLDKGETQNYIQHRLRHVGWAEDPAFEAAAYDHIHDLSGGIPRRINALCDRLLLACYLAGEHTVSAELTRQTAEEMCQELEPSSPANALPKSGYAQPGALRSRSTHLADSNVALGAARSAVNTYPRSYLPSHPSTHMSQALRANGVANASGTCDSHDGRHSLLRSNLLNDSLFGSDERLEDVEDRIAALESSLQVVQSKLRRALRQLERLTGESKPEP